MSTLERWEHLVNERNPLAHAEALGLPHDAQRLAAIRAELDILEAESAEDNAAAIEPPAFTGTAAEFGEWIEEDDAKCHAGADHGPAVSRGSFGDLCDPCWARTQRVIANFSKREASK